MRTNVHPNDVSDPPPRRDYSGLIILAGLALLEVGTLYVLIAVDTPLAPAVRRAVQHPLGLFSVVVTVLGVLMVGIAGVLTWVQRRSRKGGPIP